METAENIGRSCNLIQDHFTVMKLCYNKEKETSELVNERLKAITIENQELVKKKLPKALLLECEAIRKFKEKYIFLYFESLFFNLLFYLKIILI